MKNKILKLTAIVLFFAGTISCENKNDEPQSNVPYKPCDCEKEKYRSFKGEAILFKDLTEKQMNEKIYHSGFSGSLLFYNSIADNARLYSVHIPMVGIGNICNFPDFAKKWNIPEQGHKVYIAGDAYLPCTLLGGIATVTYADLVLTTLILK